MRPGRLDRRVTLQSRVLTRNDHGEEVVSWTDLATVWAEKQDLRGREFWAAQQVNAEIGTRWRIRWRDDVNAINRLVCDEINYDIQVVAEVGRQQGLELMCTGAVP